MSDAAHITDDELAAMESRVRFLFSGAACDTMRLIAEVRRLRAERAGNTSQVKESP